MQLPKGRDHTAMDIPHHCPVGAWEGGGSCGRLLKYPCPRYQGLHSEGRPEENVSLGTVSYPRRMGAYLG